MKSPTVLIVVDRTDLDTQIAATFNAANVPNMVTTDSIKELHDHLERDVRMQNDVLDDIPFWPKYIDQKGEMINWIDADNFCWYKNRNGINILPNLRQDDNPVIIIANIAN